MAVPEVDGERPKACFSRGAAEKLALRPATTSAAVQPDCSTQNSQMIETAIVSWRTPPFSQCHFSSQSLLSWRKGLRGEICLVQ